MSETGMKQQLRADLTSAMKARDSLKTATLRMVLAAISESEVAGQQARELSDSEVLDVVIAQAKRRREAAAEFRAGGRDEMAEKELREAAILADYLPAQLSESEIAELVTEAIDAAEARELGMRAMGAVMGRLTPQTKGRADGAAVAAEVRRQLSS